MSKTKIFSLILAITLIGGGLFFATHRYFLSEKSSGSPLKQSRAEKIIPKTGRIVDSFHTGTAARWIMDSSLFAGKNLPELQEVYERWKKHNPDEFLTYAYVDKCANIDDKGNLLPRKKCPHSWYVDAGRLTIILKHLYSRGYIPILKIQIGNFETVGEKGAKNFLLWLSNQTNGKEIIFILNGEFNFPPEVKGWGYGREGGKTNKIEPGNYNRQIAMWVKVRNKLELKNIYLGCQANILQRPRAGSKWSQYWKPERFIKPYLPGIRLLDVIGASHYRDKKDLNLSWKLTKEFYDMVGQPQKPFFFIEYAPSSPWKHKNIVTSDFIDASYKMLAEYKFVKAINFYFGPYFTDETIKAIKKNALRYVKESSKESKIENLAREVVEKFMISRIQRNEPFALSFLTEKAKKEYEKPGLTLIGTSNPHFVSYKVLETKKLGDEVFEFRLRILENYGRTPVGWFDEDLILKKVDSKYLIDEVKRGKYQSLK